jgi:hypothetical protein
LSTEKRANNVERTVRDARNGSDHVLDRRIHDGLAMTVFSFDAKQGKDTGRLAFVVKRLRAHWIQRRHEDREFRIWLEVTAQ